MASKFSHRLTELRFETTNRCIAPNEYLVKEYEDEFDLSLPDDYREFLVHHAGIEGTATCTVEEPTPFGDTIHVENFFGFSSENYLNDVYDKTDLIDGAPVIVAIADNVYGGHIWLKCLGQDRGSVYYFDHQKRNDWPDEWFYKHFPNLHPPIREYLDRRRNGTLPTKRKGYEHLYLLAQSFSGFIHKLKPDEDSD